jgi:hypothetical protein
VKTEAPQPAQSRPQQQQARPVQPRQPRPQRTEGAPQPPRQSQRAARLRDRAKARPTAPQRGRRRPKAGAAAHKTAACSIEKGALHRGGNTRFRRGEGIFGRAAQANGR